LHEWLTIDTTLTNHLKSWASWCVGAL